MLVQLCRPNTGKQINVTPLSSWTSALGQRIDVQMRGRRSPLKSI
jgi:hypothetical protein